MNNAPLISIIMPCFNAERFLPDAVRSVMEQRWPSLELIIIDDGSTDGSLAVAEALSKRYDDIHLLTQTNRGPYPARNKGLAHARGRFVAFLDADDYWHPDFLRLLHQKLESDALDIAYCGWQNVVENGENGPEYVPPAYEQEENRILRFLKGCPWPIHAALVRKEKIDEIGGFSTRYFSAMDYDFWLKLATVTQKIGLVPRVLAYYRWHDAGQISSVKWRQVLHAWSVRREFVQAHPDLITGVSEKELDEIVNGYLRDQAYDAFWKRDLTSAQKLFRTMARHGVWRVNDLKYLVPALLPNGIFHSLVSRADRQDTRTGK